MERARTERTTILVYRQRNMRRIKVFRKEQSTRGRMLQRKSSEMMWKKQETRSTLLLGTAAPLEPPESVFTAQHSLQGLLASEKL